jgi:AGCS family alanine or glycine:cation symporter
MTDWVNSLIELMHIDFILSFFKTLNGIVWGPYMLVLILGTGLYLMLGLRFIPLRRLTYGFTMLWQGRTGRGKGDITSFNALMTELSATIGTGNIAGVATAIFLGGPGALFWMWCTALVGMATKYTEAVCAVHYRENDEAGNHVGGPMYYIKNGLKKQWQWLGGLFAVFGAIAGFGIGNTVQANSVAHILNASFSIPTWVTGVTLAVLVGVVLIGGIHRLAEVSGRLVPFMAVVYVGGGLVILAMHIDKLPHALSLIFTHAFTPTAVTGGFAGATVWAAIQFGVARGVFSNEAGLGSSPIAHATARVDEPVQQGVVAMLGVFIDTIVVCSITGLVIIVSGTWDSGKTGAELSSLAFGQALPYVGSYLVTFGLLLFVFTTLLGWSFYSEKCVQYLFGFKSIKPFRWLWIIAIPIGAVLELNLVWLIADTLNALMAVPNLIALLLLSPVVFKLTREHFSSSAQSP